MSPLQDYFVYSGSIGYAIHKGIDSIQECNTANMYMKSSKDLHAGRHKITKLSFEVLKPWLANKSGTEKNIC